MHIAHADIGPSVYAHVILYKMNTYTFRMSIYNVIYVDIHGHDRSEHNGWVGGMVGGIGLGDEILYSCCYPCENIQATNINIISYFECK